VASVYYDARLSDEERRAELWRGAIFVHSPTPGSVALCALARAMLEEGFGGVDPRRVHDMVPVDDTVAILTRLKPAFIHHPECKKLIPQIMTALGVDIERTYFDVPRMRSAYPSDYLTAGIAYAFHPHRDTWYSAPQCQINWWLPIYDLAPNNCLAFYPHHFDHPVENNSEIYNYYRWNATSRRAAAGNVKTDSRPQPKPQGPVIGPDIRLLCPPGGLIVFAGAQLHATVENTSGIARYSIDFRTVHIDDVTAKTGAPNIDSRCTGTTMRDYIRCSDLAKIPEAVVSLYDDGSEAEGVLVYEPHSAT
jgi:hypothetical protein